MDKISEEDIVAEEESRGEESFRDYTKRLEKTNKELEGVAKKYLFKEVGLDPDKGTGKMAADLYSGKLNTEDLSTWLAENYGIEANLVQESNNDVAAEKIVESDARLETMQQQSVPVGEEDPMAILNTVVNEGTVEESIRAKLYMRDRVKQENK